MDIDIFINVINNTLLSPTFCAFIPLAFYGQVRSFLHPAVYISTAWTALIIIIGKLLNTSLHLWCVLKCIAILNHINRIYTNRSEWSLAHSKLEWSKQIVLITGGEPFSSSYAWILTISGGSGIGALLAQTLAMRNVTTVVLSKDPVLVDPSNGKLLQTRLMHVLIIQTTLLTACSHIHVTCRISKRSKRLLNEFVKK